MQTLHRKELPNGTMIGDTISRPLEHNQFIDPQTVKMPTNRREDFILIPGEEVTGGNDGSHDCLQY